MATSAISETVLNVASDAIYRRIATVIHNSIAACGLTQCTSPEVTATQINLTTVTKPGTTVTEAGFEVWKFTDSGTKFAFYIRIGYSSGNATTQFALTFQCGTAVDTSGNVNTSGNFGTKSWICSSTGNAPADLPWTCYASGDGHSFRIAFFTDIILGAAYWGGCFTACRSRDSSGAETNNYVLTSCHGNPSAVTSYALSTPISWIQKIYNPTVGTVWPSNTNGPYHRPICAAPSNLFGETPNALTTAKRCTASSQEGLGMFPTYPYEGGAGNHTLDTCLYFLHDMGTGQTESLSIFGANHTYLCVGGVGWRTFQIASTFLGDNGNPWPSSFMILWE